MSKRRSLPHPSSNSRSSTNSSNLSSNSSREGSSGHTSSTSVSSGYDSNSTPSRKAAAKPIPTPLAQQANENGNSASTTSEGSIAKTARQRSVTAFLNKLFRMVSEPSTNDLIHWSTDGNSFIVEHQDDFSKILLPRYFKHNTFASFIRQLNMYNFHKVPHVEERTLISDTTKDVWEFSNPNFQRGRLDLLSFVYRKRIHEREKSKSESSIHSLLQTSQAIRQRQSSLSSEIRTLKEDFQTLWKDMLAVREHQQKRYASFIKIIQFLSYLTRHIVQTNSGENTAAEDLPRKLLTCPDTTELLKFAEQHSPAQYQPNSRSQSWPAQPSLITAPMPTSMSDEEMNNTLASTVRSVTAIANDIENLNRNVELLAKKYSYDFDTDELAFGANPAAAALPSLSANHNDSELNIIQYQHIGKRPTTAPNEDISNAKKRAATIIANQPIASTAQSASPNFDSWSTPQVFKIEMESMKRASMPTIAMRRATSKAVVPPIISETCLANLFQPQRPPTSPLPYTATSTVSVVPLATGPQSNLVDETSFVSNEVPVNMEYNGFDACDYSKDDVNEFSGLFGPPVP